MWSYNRLWKLLIDKGMKKTELMEAAQIHSTTLARMSKGEPVSMEALGKICEALHCQVEDIVQYIADES